MTDADLNGNGLRPGTPVRLTRPVDRYPHFLAEAGSKGVVTDVGDRQIVLAVKMDLPLAGAEEWDNEIHWFDVPLAEALADVEVIEGRDLIVRFDVTGMTQAEAERLAYEAEVQGEESDCDPQDEYYHPEAGASESRFEPPFEEPQPVDQMSHGFTVVLVDSDDGSEGDFVYVESFDSSQDLEAAFTKGDLSSNIMLAAEQIDARTRDEEDPNMPSPDLAGAIAAGSPVAQQPTVSLKIGDSTIAFEETGEILETVDYLEDGSPDWSSAAICDHRGGGGQEGFALLALALGNAEKNAKMIGETIVRVPRQS